MVKYCKLKSYSNNPGFSLHISNIFIKICFLTTNLITSLVFLLPAWGGNNFKREFHYFPRKKGNKLFVLASIILSHDFLFISRVTMVFFIKTRKLLPSLLTYLLTYLHISNAFSRFIFLEFLRSFMNWLTLWFHKFFETRKTLPSNNICSSFFLQTFLHNRYFES